MDTKNYLKSFFTEHWKYLLVSTACKLNLFDLIENNGMDVKQTSSKLNLNEKYTHIFLKALCSIGFLKETNSIYFINELSSFLTESNPESLKYACMVWSEEHLIAWSNLEYSIQSGSSSFEKLYSQNFFDYIENKKDKQIKYHKAMYEYARDDYKNLFHAIDFSKHKSIMDVGGGYGFIINQIQTKYSQVECYLLDKKKVNENSVVNCKVIKLDGDFFYEIPNKAEAIILSRILHDWDDHKATIILKNVYNSLPKEGFLYVIENCTDKVNIDMSVLSLNMIVMCNSYERTSVEYTSLIEKIGFQYDYEVKINELQTILIFKKSNYSA